MNGNEFGRLFRMTTYGESHGEAMAVPSPASRRVSNSQRKRYRKTSTGASPASR